ncbi:hypothetical protein ABT336_02420 [Micromonospora sp. NPDC000207]|uniref:hypothetical protein n=1 Tax=Micromonospora sp. NPDC000207 TaxID=3154246 RepID=UPI0033186646
MWWVGCHGGAGTSTLAALAGFGADFGASWPALTPDMPSAQVVLVCRATATGTWAATGVIEQWKRRHGVSRLTDVVGVVAVAASARRQPKIVTDRLRLLGGWTPNLWRIGWVEALLAADDPRDVGVPPDVEALRHAIWHRTRKQEGTR